MFLVYLQNIQMYVVWRGNKLTDDWNWFGICKSVGGTLGGTRLHLRASSYQACAGAVRESKRCGGKFIKQYLQARSALCNQKTIHYLISAS